MVRIRVLSPAVAGALFAVTNFIRPCPAQADDLACVSTTFRFVGANDQVCVSAFDDPKVSGVACDISQARKGGIKGSLGLAEDPSRFSLACRQVGPISTDLNQLPQEESIYSERTSIFFKTPVSIESWIRSGIHWCISRSATRSSTARRRTHYPACQ